MEDGSHPRFDKFLFVLDPDCVQILRDGRVMLVLNLEPFPLRFEDFDRLCVAKSAPICDHFFPLIAVCKLHFALGNNIFIDMPPAQQSRRVREYSLLSVQKSLIVGVDQHPKVFCVSTSLKHRIERVKSPDVLVLFLSLP